MTGTLNRYPGFVPVRIAWSEFVDPQPEHEGERVLWADGSAHSFPEDDSDELTVLRRIDAISSA